MEDCVEIKKPVCGNRACTSKPNWKAWKQCGTCGEAFYCNRECQVAAWSSHMPLCKRRPNYIIKFHLCPEVIVDPPIIRTLSCPALATMHELHKALQIAFD